MADVASTILPIQTGSNDGMFGGGTLGAVLLGSLLPRLTGNGFGNGNGMMGYGDGMLHNRNADVLQALNQQQLATSTQILTQDVNHLGKDIATSAGATQAAVAAANLSQTVATLQGQTALTSSIMDSTLTNVNGHANIMSGQAALAADVNSNMNALANNINSGIHQLGDAINASNVANLNATHRAEVTGLESAYRTLQAITTDGDRTRDMISNINTADLNRQITVAENKLAEALGDRRNDRASHDIIINNNNNATAVANALAQQSQQQQIANISSGLAAALAHIQTQTQTVVNTGRMTGNSMGQVAV
jgi:hypothetical protein